jgi:hypothetical protein
MHPTRFEVLGFLSGFGLNISSDITLFSAKRIEGATKEYSAKTSADTSTPPMVGAMPGESTGSMFVNSSLKFETSVGETILGMNGAGMFLRRRSSQLIGLKKS